MIPSKVQLEQKDLEFMEEVCRVFNYKSRSEYMRAAILEKIRADRRKLREMKRQDAMEAYDRVTFEKLFESVEAEDFEDR